MVKMKVLRVTSKVIMTYALIFNKVNFNKVVRLKNIIIFKRKTFLNEV